MAAGVPSLSCSACCGQRANIVTVSDLPWLLRFSAYHWLMLPNSPRTCAETWASSVSEPEPMYQSFVVPPGDPRGQYFSKVLSIMTLFSKYTRPLIFEKKIFFVFCKQASFLPTN